MSDIQETVNNLLQELRRGTLILCVLSQLKSPKYGYSLVETLGRQGVKIEPGTLYPLLRRLEKQNLLKSEWETAGNKPRKYYSLCKNGKKVYSLLCEEWDSMAANINKLIREGE